MSPTPVGRFLAGALACVLASRAAAQTPRALTLDDLYDPVKRVNLAGTPPSPLSWIDATHYATTRTTPDGPEWIATDAESGSSTLLFRTARLEQALVAAGLTADQARIGARSRSLAFDRSHARVLFALSGDLFTYTLATNRLVRLTATPAAEDLATFSPDGALVAFVRDNNLFVADVATGRETRLTADGSDTILNGRLDWVYEEEIFGRGQPRAYWWSPDSKRLAYLRIDDGPVPVFTVVDHVPYEQGVERWRYPKAGEPNPIATLGTVAVAGGSTRWVNVSKYPDADRLIAAVAWSADSREVVFQVQNRLQTWLDLNAAPAESGAARTLFRETGRAWVTDVADPIWLKDGSFLWLSERSGFKHVYHYAADGRLRRQVTSGSWEVRTLHGVDEAAGWVYFGGSEHSPIADDVYRIRLAGDQLERLTPVEGNHAASFGPGFAFFTDTWSDVNTPPQVRLRRSDGTAVRTLEPNRVEALSQFTFSRPEFLQVKTRDGFAMEAMIIKPPNFDPARRYPVYTFVYGGPHSQRVRNAWASENLFHQLLAQQGIIVWECDNRTASGKGLESTWPVYRNFGELELKDVEDGLAWLKAQPFVDANRIGIHGWSFGGFLTAYALTHSTSFTMGIAGGTVSDWRNYDSVYTERYMGPPAENEGGYQKSAPRWSVANLHGSLLLVHGLIDDNVHVDNTLQLAYELQKAQKPFDLMLYPKSRHGVVDPVLVKHLRTLMFDFVVRHLKPESGPEGTRTADAQAGR